MRRSLIGIALAGAAFAMPAQAAQVTPGSTGASIDAFDAATRGSLIAFSETSGQALTFAALFRSAVYRNNGGTLDFYYQVVRTGPGSSLDQEISSFTVSDFTGFDVFAFRDGLDFDGSGGFVAANNPVPGGFTSNAKRGPNGAVVTIDFFGTGFNGLIGTENSTTYILRTNAVTFKAGTFGVIDGSTLQGTTFAPATAVPEPATWALMIGGFGLAGIAMRRARRVSVAFG